MSHRYTRDVYKEIGGKLCKWAAALALFIFSITLSLSFYSHITPPDKPWFPIAALGLTEVGFICWLTSFLLTHQDTESDIIALVMVVVCGASTIIVDGAELARMFSSADIQVSYPWTGTLVYGVLVFLLACHMVSFFLELVLGYFKSHPTIAPSAPLGSVSVQSLPHVVDEQPERSLPPRRTFALPPGRSHRKPDPIMDEEEVGIVENEADVSEDEEEEEEEIEVVIPSRRTTGKFSRQPVQPLPPPSKSQISQVPPVRARQISQGQNGGDDARFLSHLPSHTYPPGRGTATTSTMHRMGQPPIPPLEPLHRRASARVEPQTDALAHQSQPIRESVSSPPPAPSEQVLFS